MRFSRRRQQRRLERDEAGPSAPEPSEVESLHGDIVREEDVSCEESSSPVPLFISLAIFAVSAVYFAVQRFFDFGGDGRREKNPRAALVLPLQTGNKPDKRSPGDSNLTFVVPEDFKLDWVPSNKTRDVWQRTMCYVPEECILVDQLLRAGSRCIGRAYTEPIPFNLIEVGDDVFRNPVKAGRVTGGEYSGCAVLVGAGHADFGLALDTIGSLRMAAACCGVIGFKPTRGSLLLNGISVKSEALDTVGFMTKKVEHLVRLGEMFELSGNRDWRGNLMQIYLAKDLFDGWINSEGKEMAFAVAKAALSWAGQDQVEDVELGDFLSSHATGWTDFDSEDVYEALRKAGTTIAGYELKRKLLKDYNMAVEDTSEEAERYRQALGVKLSVQEAFKQGIRESKVVVFPAMMRPPPTRSSNEETLMAFEIETQRLQALASLVGCPQLVFPVHNKKGDLYSVSMIGLNKTDKQLLAIAEKLIPLTYRMLDSELHQDSRPGHSENDIVTERLSEADREGENWKERGNECFRNSEYERAVVAYTEAIQRCPYKATYYSNRAMAYIKLMQFEQAEDDCCKALYFDANNAKALLRRGVARKGLRMYIDAQEDFEKVLRVEPNNRQATNELHDLERFLY